MTITYSSPSARERASFKTVKRDREEARRFEEERQKKEAPALRECPHCHTAINRGYGKKQFHCGRDACRQAISRQMRVKRKVQAREDTKAQIWQYCSETLNQDQRRAIMDMVHQLMTYNMDEGHELAAKVVEVIDDIRCKHDYIKLLIDTAAAAEKRAEQSANYASEMESLYLRRIDALEKQLQTYEHLQSAVYEIALDQERKQSDPPERQPPAEPELSAEEADAERTRAQLRSIGLIPISDLSAAELAAQDGEEYEQGGEYGAEEDGAEEE